MELFLISKKIDTAARAKAKRLDQSHAFETDHDRLNRLEASLVELTKANDRHVNILKSRINLLKAEIKALKATI